MTLRTCEKCAGTGEEFDPEKDDWTDPIKTCERCEGIGFVSSKCDPEYDGECVPNHSGHCIVCGYELVREVDDNGIPLDELKWADERD